MKRRSYAKPLQFCLILATPDRQRKDNLRQSGIVEPSRAYHEVDPGNQMRRTGMETSTYALPVSIGLDISMLPPKHSNRCRK